MVCRVCSSILVSAGLLVGLARAAEEEPSAPAPNLNVALLLRLQGTDLTANPNLRTVLNRTLEATVGTPDFLELVRAFQIKDRDAGLMATALAHAADSTGAEAVRLVLDHGSLDEIRKALDGSEAESVLAILGNVGERAANELIKPVVLDAKRATKLRTAAVRAIATTRDGAAWLLKLAQDKLLPEELKPIASLELGNVRWPEIKESAAQFLPPTQSNTVDPLPSVDELIGRKGDPALGERVFFESGASCSRCHQVRGQGVDFGPNLSEIGDKYGKDGIYAAILTPSAGIGFGFEAWQVEFKNGDEAFGLIASETADEITMKAVGGISKRYNKETIARRVQQQTSIMPEGLGPAIGVRDLLNLVEFLTTLRKPAE